ncbi:porin family protein [Bradyrhizobium diazoefficiens]|uniref:outer membrane protein n=1 Tax=Bradyrhizobium diazoefficiens TaxID=1355477 RepID=UPI00190D3142|nr:outer membrane beta-barrel protein [Bradyrhizobium diazoefficiens]MBK3660161.1 porin family protein [Bradyrhizobium diazoefficiens]
MQLRLTSILASLMLVAGLGAASAADMAVKALPPPPVVDSWTGFYLGLNAGGIWGSNHLTATPADPGTTAFWGPCFGAGACPRDHGRNTGTSGEVGGQLGYNWQVRSFVVGVETDIQWTDVKSAPSVALTNLGTGFVAYNGAASAKLEWFGTTRGRLGFLAMPNLLLYGTGGVAYGSVASSWTASFVPPASQFVAGFDRSNRVGWVAGAGAEWKLNRNWIVGVEYLHMELQSRSFGATGFGSPGCTASDCNFTVNANDFKTDTVRARLSYEFAGGPVLAKY